MIRPVIKIHEPIKAVIQYGEIFSGYIAWDKPIETFIYWTEHANHDGEPGYTVGSGIGYDGFDTETCLFHRYSDGNCQEHCFRILAFLK